MAPTEPVSECNPAVHHIEIPTVGVFFSCPVLPGPRSCSIVVQYDGADLKFFAQATEFMSSVVRPSLVHFLTTPRIGVLGEEYWRSSIHMLVHAFARLAVDLCCLEPESAHAGVSHACVICAPCGVVGSTRR